MTFSPQLPFPVAMWPETPLSGAALALTRLYWAFDVPSQTWTLSTVPAAAAGKLASASGAPYTLYTTGTLPGGAAVIAPMSLGGITVLFS